MRHRITSFRCVEAEEECDSSSLEVQDLYLREISANSSPSRDRHPPQTRQSSITRAVSAHGGTTNGGCVPTVNAMRPRLEAMASSKESKAASSIVRRAVAGLKLDATLRVCELVQTLIKGAAAVAVRPIVTRR